MSFTFNNRVMAIIAFQVYYIYMYTYFVFIHIFVVFQTSVGIQ